MNFLFLDLSTKSTGYAISDDKGKLITYGLLTASSSNNISRIQKIQSGIIFLGIPNLFKTLFNITTVNATKIKDKIKEYAGEKISAVIFG